ncbi:glycosyltransferase family 2 protein [Latilactobacillus sakei]|uniref:glycosyltransferase family 2 protein n=1 Tax=Latilactobacillus sakei TaxID=1599 RepID=UPI00097846F1|nr:glycosyltransferase [Latilactobacillus sakei]
MKIGLAIPTYNAGEDFKDVLAAINSNSDLLSKKIIIDSESNDGTRLLAKNAGFTAYNIKRSEFTHGLVRNKIANTLSDCDYIIYMTQDVYIKKNAIKNIYDYITEYPDMAIAYGKQIVDISKSDVFEQRDRIFNYPDKSIVKRYSDKDRLGIKTVFSSDAFAIYKTEYLMEIGNFPVDVKYSEDMYMAALAIKHNFSVGYCATAIVTHSHHFNLRDQFKRYRFIGRFNKEYSWIQKEFGSNEREGVKKVIDEIKYLSKNKKVKLIPYSILRNLVKFIGYKMA